MKDEEGWNRPQQGVKRHENKYIIIICYMCLERKWFVWKICIIVFYILGTWIKLGDHNWFELWILMRYNIGSSCMKKG